MHKLVPLEVLGSRELFAAIGFIARPLALSEERAVSACRRWHLRSLHERKDYTQECDSRSLALISATLGPTMALQPLFVCYRVAPGLVRLTQCPVHNAFSFRLLLKETVCGTHQCVLPHFLRVRWTIIQ